MRYWLFAISYGLAALGGCFSDREATAPLEGVCSLPLGEGVPGSTLVVIRGFTFGPTEVRVRAGDRVTWVNCDQDPHTSGPAHQYGGWWAVGVAAARER
jgi:hypothetical protein